MGRKGGGRAGFMKASRKGPDSDEEEEIAPKAAPGSKEPAKAADTSASNSEPAKPVISKKAAAFLVGSGDGSDDGSDGEDNAQDCSASGETRGKMQQRHKREAKAMKDQVKRLGKKGKDEAAKLEAEMKSRHETELASLAPPSGRTTADVVAVADSLYSATLADDEAEAGGASVKVKKPTKAQRRREQKAKDDAERDARIAAENAELGETERMAEEKALKKLLAPLGLAVKDIPADGHCLYRSLGTCGQILLFYYLGCQV